MPMSKTQAADVRLVLEAHANYLPRTDAVAYAGVQLDEEVAGILGLPTVLGHRWDRAADRHVRAEAEEAALLAELEAAEAAEGDPA